MLNLTKDKKGQKRLQINTRSNEYIDDLLTAMMAKEDKDKTKIVHAAIEYYANYVLGQDEIQNIKLYHLFEKKI